MGKSAGLRGLIPIILSKPAVQKMHFTCGSRHLNGAIFSQVADRLRKRKIHIDVDPTRLAKISPDAAAMYLPRRHTFVFSSPFFGQNVFEQAEILHECVHAGWDVIGHGRRFRSIDDEASGYLAQSFFLMSAGITFDQLYEPSLAHQLAFTIAENMRDKKQSSVSADDLVLLRNGVNRDGIDAGSHDLRSGTDEAVYRGIPP
jgi:hypothetical protein